MHSVEVGCSEIAHHQPLAPQAHPHYLPFVIEGEKQAPRAAPSSSIGRVTTLRSRPDGSARIANAITRGPPCTASTATACQRVLELSVSVTTRPVYENVFCGTRPRHPSPGSAAGRRPVDA